MARITFVYPDFESLGVEYLMAVCSKAGHEVQFVYYESWDVYFGRPRGNIPYEQIAVEICQTAPDIAAFSCVTDNYQHQLQVAQRLKGKDNHILTIFGGIHPTAVPEKVLQNPCVDAAAIGEAEHSLVDLLSASEASGGLSFPDQPVPGIVFKKNGRMVGEFAEGRLADLDLLPFPQKQSFLAVLRNPFHGYRIMTSRGCPYHCSYCFNSYMLRLRNGKVIRRRSVANVIAELHWARKEFSIQHVFFLDDSFTTHKRWLKDFCAQYKAEINLPFACIANPFYIDEEIAEVLASAGCVNMQLGVQSLSEPVCAQVLDRKSSNEKISAVLQQLKRRHIMVQIDHMLGIPGDTLETQEDSILFYNAHRPDLISVFWLTYYPQTTIVDTAKKAGILTSSDIERIEQGLQLTSGSVHSGGSMKNPAPYYGVGLLLNYLPLLPKWCVTLLLESRIYRLFRVRSYFISTALPSAIQSIFNKRYFRGRSHILRFIGKFFGSLFRRERSLIQIRHR